MSYPIETMRHSAAHVMAAAIQKLFPDVKFGVGPAIEHGFYYDIDIGRAVTPEDLKAIEKGMWHIVNQDAEFVREEMSLDEAVSLFEKLNQPYKVELLKDLKEKGTTRFGAEEAGDVDPANTERATVYRTGTFTDLCRGPHVSHAKEVGAWKIMKSAGAYWRGNQENPQMQRIYGVCFATQEELAAHLVMLEEAKKRDHKVLGPALDLFTFSDLVGPGLPLWTPRGTILRDTLDAYVWELRHAKGYERVEIPHITKKELYETSGHWAKFKDELFRIVTREGHEFAMKPMNCPHHTQIYARRQWSYRELPQRYANTTMCYRDEQTGELSGLSRARSFTQDDAHVFCRMSQVKEEFLKIWDVIHTFYGTFGFSLTVRVSLHDPAHPDKYLGDPARWQDAEGVLREIVKGQGTEAFEAVGEAAFYGPKLDFMAKDSLGREWQVATIQLDMNMPERFDLSCINEQGEAERIVMIHAAIMGSIERFLSIAIEHYAGAFPLWLAPEQVRLLPVADRHVEFGEALATELREKGLRVEVDASAESIPKKVRNAEHLKIPVMLVVGDKEAGGEALAVRRYGIKDQTTQSKDELVAGLLEEIRSRK
ncbi:threonine--tRNA ligase [Patescibacteria group bacterium]|nr:threonine--tRNA ligase [Patescibacteria group bacterium]MBU1448249.1 threonine--tRNA ligase [Patescibacteria group bacterium]MBU2613685.1 threonine--tRNA ligase [Patescibacteria group bacterium]